MRVSKEQESQNRQAIIKVASALSREQDYKATEIAALVRAAGFTYGSSPHNPLISRPEGEGVAGLSFEDYVTWLASHLESQNRGEAPAPSISEQHIPSPGDAPSQVQESTLAISLDEESEKGPSFYTTRIEMYLELLMEYLPLPDISQQEQASEVTRQRALYLLNQLVGSMILSCSVVKNSPRLAEEIMNSGIGTKKR